MCELLKSVPARSTVILGPYETEKMLLIKRVGVIDRGDIHLLTAPVIYDYTKRQNKLLEVLTLPCVFLMEKYKTYQVSTFVSSVDYQIEEVKISMLANF